MQALQTYFDAEKFPFGLNAEDKREISGDFFHDLRPKDTGTVARIDKSVGRESGRTLLEDVYVPFFSPFVNERAKLQGGCFIRFPLCAADSGCHSNLESYSLESFVLHNACFKDCIAEFVFINPTKISQELSMLNLKTSRIYPEVEQLALGIKQRLFESEGAK